MIRWKKKHPKLGRTPLAWLKEFGPKLKSPELRDKWKEETGEDCTRKTFEQARPRFGINFSDEGWARHYAELSGISPDNALYSGISAEALVKALKDKPTSIADLSRKFDRSERTIEEALEQMRADGYAIVEIPGGIEVPTKRELPKPKLMPLLDEAGAKFMWGVATDTHHGSIGAQITSFHRFVDEAYRLGVRHILHAGDVFAGVDNFTEQNYELYAHGADEQKQCVLEDYPKKPGLEYYLIGGNHDFSYVKSGGYNIVRAVCQEREDLVYAGFHLADIPLTNHITARLWHPMGGVPYAASYRLQKGVEQMVLEEFMTAIQKEQNPSLRFVIAGHLHIRLSMGMGPIWGYQSGCFEGWTSYLKRKGLAPNRGGYIIEVTLDKKDKIQRVREEFIPFFEMEEDYKSWHVPHVAESEKAEIPPLFAYEGGDGDG